MGSGEGVSIKELVDTLVKIYGGEVDVQWDKTKPNGDKIRLMDMTREEANMDFILKQI